MAPNDLGGIKSDAKSDAKSDDESDHTWGTLKYRSERDAGTPLGAQTERRFKNRNRQPTGRQSDRQLAPGNRQENLTGNRFWWPGRVTIDP